MPIKKEKKFKEIFLSFLLTGVGTDPWTRDSITPAGGPGLLSPLPVALVSVCVEGEEPALGMGSAVGLAVQSRLGDVVVNPVPGVVPHTVLETGGLVVLLLVDVPGVADSSSSLAGPTVVLL